MARASLETVGSEGSHRKLEVDNASKPASVVLVAFFTVVLVRILQ
ncbi:MAG: hypothetical protein ACI9N9_002991 [Enterobacterales bacterium]|jgi:hypothetical protein